MKTNTDIFLFTHSYPYSQAAEHTFLEKEVFQLAKNVKHLTLIPKFMKGNFFSLPSNVVVEEGFSIYYQKHNFFPCLFWKALRSNYFYQEIIKKQSLLIQPIKFLRLILSIGRAEIVREWVEVFVKKQTQKEALYYSYWFDEITIALGMVKSKILDIKFISRAHGYDMYEELYFPFYFPLRKETLFLINKVFPASNHGENYFKEKYPEFTAQFETAYLGINDPGFISKSSLDEVLRIISCSHILALKRVDLLIKAIICIAKMRPHQKFEWQHFGDGPAIKKLRQIVKNKFPNNATGNLIGYIDNKKILDHYKEKPVDVFINLSTTEGGAPVSIQEATSCGIPIIATNVGGNPEIVSERNGILLSANPTPEEIAHAILKLIDNPEMAQKMRIESRKVWQESYNAETNFQKFAERLKEIAEG